MHAIRWRPKRSASTVPCGFTLCPIMSAPAPAPAVVVVGSSNMDLITYVDTLPKLGETIHGRSCAWRA